MGIGRQESLDDSTLRCINEIRHGYSFLSSLLTEWLALFFDFPRRT